MSKSPLRFVAKLVLFGMLLLLVLEFVTRLFVPQQLIVYQQFYGPNDNGLGLFPLPEIDMMVNTGERDARLITDERGFRVGPTAQPSDPDGRILLVGDSYVLAVQVDYEQTVGGFLEKEFGQHGLEVVVDNSGSASFDLNHYKIIIEQQLREQSYDSVVVFLNHTNDLISQTVDYFQPVESRVRQLRLPSSLSRAELIDAVAYPINDWLERNSQLFVLLKSRAQTTLAQWGLTAFYFPWTLLKENVDRPEWEVSGERIREISAIGDALGVPIIFVLVPTSHQVDTTWLDFYVDAFDIDRDDVDLLQPNSRLASLLGDDDIIFVDLYDAFADSHASGVHLYGRIDSHFSPEGNLLMANALYPMVASRLQPEQAIDGAESTARISNQQ